LKKKRVGSDSGRSKQWRAGSPQTLLGTDEGKNGKIGLRWDHRVIGLLYHYLDGLRSK